jgi:hypothetical protein
MNAMRRAAASAARSRQRGWIGIVMILVALVIVAVLAKDGLKALGLGSTSKATSNAGTPGERARAPGAIGAESLDIGSGSAAPASALDRARGVEDMMKQQAAERAGRGDGTAR